MAVEQDLSGGPAHRAILKRRLLFAAKLAVTVLAFVLVATLADVSEALSLMRNQSFFLLLLAALAVLGQIVLGALRWRAVLMASVPQSEAQISPALAFRLYYTSIFFNAFLPGGSIGGDVARALSTRALGVTTGAAVHSVVLDRILTLCALLLMAVPAAPLIWGSAAMSSTIVLGGSGAVALAVLAWQLAGAVDSLRPMRERVMRLAAGFLASMGTLLSRPLALLAALVFALGAHACYCLSAYLIARSIGVELSLLDALVLMPLVFLVSTIPISIGGWGVREVGAIGLLGLVGVPGHEAVIVSLQFGVISTLMALPGGLVWLSRGPKRVAAS